MNYIEEYYAQIKSGKIVAGKWIKRVYAYLVKGLQKELFFFDQKKCDLAVDFIERFCHHSEGRSDRIKLELWQKAALAAIFAIVDDEGLRVFREIFIVVARKNGKTLFASAIIEYVNFLDGEFGAKTFCLAPKLEQAAKVYDGYLQMLLLEPGLSPYWEKRRSDIYMPTTNSSVKPLAFNAKKSDGFNPHLTICDEIASWPAEQGRKQYEVMKSALGARKQPLIISISTAGYINDGPYDDLMTRSTAFLQGGSKERRLLPLLYIVDDPEKWDTKRELQKSNPNLDVSVPWSYYKEEIAVARLNASKLAEFKTKYCCVKQNAVSAWLPYEVVAAATKKKYTLDDFRGSYCVGGIDLSQTTDLTACSVVIEKEEKLYTFCQFFMPANKIDELQERESTPYQIFRQQGLLTLSGENYVDYNDCFNWFKMLVEEYEILPLAVGYDRYSAQYLIQQMEQYGFHCQDVFQGWNLSPVLLQAEGLLRDKTLHLGKNNLLQQHFLNVALKQNTENRKYQPVKVDPLCHIDGFVSVIDALTARMHDYDTIGEQLKNNG